MAQIQAVATDNGAGATTVVITVAATQPGSFLGVFLGPRSTVTISSVADDKSSPGWTVATLANPDPVGGNIPAMAYCPSCTAGVTTITVTMSGSAAAIAAAVERDDIVAFDNGAIGGNGGAAVTSWTSGNSAVPAGPVVAYGWTNTGTTGLTFTAGSGWVALAGTGFTAGSRTNATDADQSFFESRVYSTALAIAATGTSTSSTQNSAVALFRLKPVTPIAIGNSRHPGRSPGDASTSWRLRQFFRADDTVAAAIGSVDGTLATTNADDTSAASGTTTVVGTLARTNANDTSSAAGTTTVLGALAKTNANDTSAASGTTTVLGTLARTNANDTLSASGSPIVNGSLARTNANDTSAASGSPVVNGSLATTNAEDTLSASGSAGAVTGSLAYTNADDTLAASGVVTVPSTDTPSPSGGYFPDFGTLRERHRKKEDPERVEIAELPKAVIQALPKSIKRRKTVTIEQLIGAASEVEMSLIDLEQIFQQAKRKKRQQDDEEILLFY